MTSAAGVAGAERNSGASSAIFTIFASREPLVTCGRDVSYMNDGAGMYGCHLSSERWQHLPAQSPTVSGELKRPVYGSFWHIKYLYGSAVNSAISDALLSGSLGW
eukprot:5212683-Prymnesium_polylepis.1